VRLSRRQAATSHWLQPPQRTEPLRARLSQVAPALAAAAVTAHTEMAHAKSVLGVNGALDFGPLAGDQPGGEGTGKVRTLRAENPALHAASLRASACCSGGRRSVGAAGAASGALPTRAALARGPRRGPWCATSAMDMTFVSPSSPQALGVNDDSLFFVLFGVTFAVGFAFAQWQSYQDDDEDDFFDGYDSRRVDKELSNRNRV
jgi:hypothetical protein